MAIKGLGNTNSPYDQINIQKQQEAEAAENGAKGVKNPARSGDNISVSEDARLLSIAMKTANETPDTRTDKVAELKAQVQGGTYSANGRTIAERLVAEELDLFE
ncbi:flagellar biosynthesis anti-sigma factor FlgM [Desulfovibrio ferrophilus]|uniref:Negative regulator of flagellin synthesis n=1 Tax=Desulfovibrio ferrophilus TaxID=241368 RepID=A0A2Z6AUA3_9BACT|nr:flagellar biosynthesis anti-sigma factor FlgM [Desulfovibrio ferrophilus]BBD06812.1 flagellar biosynthesis anti-sigma factor protein FlgM [Desulfovibrio ferrophilus]